MIVAVRKPRTAPSRRRPGRTCAVEVGDVLIGVGTADELAVLESLFTPERAVAGR